MSQAEVTVYCLVYNHEKYLRRCLESLTGQVTNFPYKVIVHDDVSTDGSREIIQEFAEKFPDVVEAVLQTENQYSKLGINMIKKCIEPLIHSKYVAICEGDDFWTDDHKLQKQYDAMEAHPECGMCLHRVREVNEDEEPTGISYPAQFYPTGILSQEDFFDSFNPRMFQTTCYFMRADLWHSYINNPPAYKLLCDIGDVPYMLFFGSSAPIYQINATMSSYRRGADSSWSNAHLANTDKIYKHQKAMVKTYRAFDKVTKGKYHSFCMERNSKHFYAVCALAENFKPFAKNKELMAALSRSKAASVYLGLVFPKAVKKMYLQHILEEKKREEKKWYDK